MAHWGEVTPLATPYTEGTEATDLMTDLRSRCLELADEMAQEINGNLFYVPDEDIDSCLADLTEANLEDTAAELANLAAWFN